MENKNPPYYKKSIETCDAILSQLNSNEERIGFLKGQAMKYLCRFGTKKGGTLEACIVECEKANWYINKLYMFLKRLEKENIDINGVITNLEKELRNLNKKDKKTKDNITKLFEKDKDE